VQRLAQLVIEFSVDEPFFSCFSLSSLLKITARPFCLWTFQLQFLFFLFLILNLGPFIEILFVFSFIILF